MQQYPREYFIELVGDQHLEARLSVNSTQKDFYVEIDLIFKESKKIFHHVQTLYQISDAKEALDQGVQALSLYLKQQRQKTSN